jgi:dihydroxyacetone kinase
MTSFANANGSHPDAHSNPHNGTPMNGESLRPLMPNAPALFRLAETQQNAEELADNEVFAIKRLEAEIATARRRTVVANERAARADALIHDAASASGDSLAEIEQQYANAIQQVREAARLEAEHIVAQARRNTNGMHHV